jgi:hypothetical protein
MVVDDQFISPPDNNAAAGQHDLTPNNNDADHQYPAAALQSSQQNIQGGIPPSSQTFNNDNEANQGLRVPPTFLDDEQGTMSNHQPEDADPYHHHDNSSIAKKTSVEYPMTYHEETREKESCGKKLCGAFAGFLFPKLTPIPWSSFVLLSLFVALP